MKYTKYVDPNQYEAVKAREKKMSKGVLEPYEVEIKAVDLNLAYVPMDNLTQKGKESQEHLRKTAECNVNRFGLSNAGVPQY